MKKLLLILVATAVICPAAHAEQKLGSSTHLPLPRFTSLREDKVNMRTGPGMRYPIAWVYIKLGLPVEVIAEYDVWRRIRDSDGDEGWVNKIELTGIRTAIVTGGAHDLRSDRNDLSQPVAHLENGAVGRLESCGKVWCALKFGDNEGFLPKGDFWGAFPDETFD
ncbi:MAG: hypothetical protein KGI97_02720 [Alphaproteobacteria bacterium]|nr:hypothetical protein [Alphaproteobacteria bacterium]